MEFKADDLLDGLIGGDPDRHPGGDERSDCVGLAMGQKNGFDLDIAGEQAADDLFAFGDEAGAFAGQFAVFEIAIGRDAGIVQRMNLVGHGDNLPARGQAGKFSLALRSTLKSQPMYEDLKIVIYPDPRLRKVSKPVKEFNEDLAALAARMLTMMRENKGVGLAAPQVGKNIRLFVMNATGEPGDDRVYVNPVLTDPDDEETGEEGCLSIPDIKTDVVRAKRMKLTAQDLAGKPIEEIQTGYPTRVWQHEIDHLNGTLIIDRMGALAKMTHRKKLKELEEKYAAEHPKPPLEKKKRK